MPKKKILIIDDDPHIVTLIKDKIEENKDYEILTAYNGKDGIELAKNERPDIITLDLIMKGITGFEVIEQLKQFEETKDIPIIVISVLEEPEKKEAFQSGINDFIVKPIDFKRLEEDFQKFIPIEEKKKNILILEEDKKIIESLDKFMNKKGFSIIVVKNPNGIIDLCISKNPAMILLDIDLPEVNVINVIKQLKFNSETKHIPILVLTNYGNKENKYYMFQILPTIDQALTQSELLNHILWEVKRLEKATVLKAPKRKILVVDDEEVITSVVKDIFDNEYNIIIAKDGEQGLEKIYSESPDLVLLDVNMPKINGYQLCKMIKDDILLRNLPIIMLTVKGEEKDEIYGLKLGADDYIVKPFKPSILRARIKSLIARSSTQLDTNPLTRLPGNIEINKKIEQRISSTTYYAVLYFDLDNFKPYNDLYGFEKGDEVIRFTARILLSNFKKFGTNDDFVGHIGGDDFIAITVPEKADTLCRKIIENFDKEIEKFYTDEDRKRNFIISIDRKGNLVKYPLLSISISVVTNLYRKYTHTGEISSVAAELKKYVKQKQGSNYLIDRRK